MIDLVSIDPGNEGGRGVCAAAFFKRGTLKHVWFLNYEEAFDWALDNTDDYAPPTVVYEQPMIYPQGHERPNDIVRLGCAGASVAAAFRPRVLKSYTPADWKGQKAKPACHLILWEKLTEDERALLPKDTFARIMKGVEVNAPRMYAQPLKNYSFKAHNLLDAIGIGFHHLGR